MTRLEDFKKLTEKAGGVITIIRPDETYAISYDTGKFTKNRKDHGSLIRHKIFGKYPTAGETEILAEFNKDSLDEFIQANITLFDETLDTERYLSYQPTYTKTKIDDIKIKLNTNFTTHYFEHNGYDYAIEKGKFLIIEPRERYHINYHRGRNLFTSISDFDEKRFDEFILEFTLDGTTVKEALEYQKEWKELCTAEILGWELGGEGYEGIYKGSKFYIGESRKDITFNLNQNEKEITVIAEDITNVFDKILINGKSFKEIYDTEYDDGETLKGYYNSG